MTLEATQARIFTVAILQVLCTQKLQFISLVVYVISSALHADR